MARANSFDVTVQQPNNQTISLSGRAKQSDYVEVLSEVLFINAEDEPGNRSITINFSITDDPFVAMATVTVQIVPTNDPVFFNFRVKTLVYEEEFQQPLFLFSSSDFLSDSDGSILHSVTIIIDSPYDAYDSLSVDSSGSDLEVLYNNSTQTLVISGVAELSTYEQVLRNVSFLNTFPGLDISQRNISVVTFDGMTSSPPHYILVDITPFDDPPICYFMQLVSVNGCHTYCTSTCKLLN